MLKKLFIGCITILVSLNVAMGAEKKEHTGKVLEFKNGGAYTYVKVQEKDKQYWAAVMKTTIKVGEEITLKEQVWMKNFKSKILKQTFDEILFADLPNREVENIHGMHGQNKKKPNPQFDKNIVVSNEKAIKVQIKDLFENKTKYKNKNVEFDAKVIQVSNKVMGNTWVKLTQGTQSVIFRSDNEDEKVNVGDKVNVKGTVNTDINFGYGYKYEVIGVNATFTKL